MGGQLELELGLCPRVCPRCGEERWPGDFTKGKPRPCKVCQAADRRRRALGLEQAPQRRCWGCDEVKVAGDFCKGVVSLCKSCQKLRRQTPRVQGLKANNDAARYLRWDSRLKHLLSAASNRAKLKGREFALTLEWAWQQLEGQHRACALTGIAFDLARAEKPLVRNPWGPSLDRIDSMAGYTPGNCRLLSNIMQCFLNQFGEKEALKAAMAFVETDRRKKERAGVHRILSG
jgi:hypothetical protein